MKILPILDNSRSFITDLSKQLLHNFKYERELNIMLSDSLYNDIFLNIKLTLSTQISWEL